MSAAFIRRGERIVIADVVEKARVDELVKVIRRALLDIDDKPTMLATIDQLITEFEGKT